MKKATGVVLSIAILPFIHGSVFADCAACTGSMGVTIQLKSGKQEKGYTPWNDFMPEQLPDGFGLRTDPRAKELLEKGANRSAGAFDYWLDLINFIAKHGLRARPNWPTHGIRVYRRLVKISYPFERYIGVKGDVVEVPIDMIAEISRNSDFSLTVDTTGIDILPEADIEMLSKEPRFTVQVEGTVGGTSYVVYGKKVTLAEVLEHAALADKNDFGAVIVNGVIIRSGHGGVGPAVSLENVTSLGPLKAECAAFIDRLGESDRAKCAAEHRGIQGQLDRLPLDSPARFPLFDRQHELRATCMSKMPGKRPEWQSLGTAENLRGMGIVVLNYAWD